MLVKKQTGLRRPRKKTLQALLEALEEIEAYFEMCGFSLGKAAGQPQVPVESEESQNEEPRGEGQQEGEAREDSGEMFGEDDEESSEGVIFDSEEIEVAIGVFLSNLVRDRILPKYPENNAPTFAEAFENIFGEGHEVIKTARSFEEHVEGYFDLVKYDDMKTAADELAEIRDMIEKELRR